jgi:ADP-heptose:LPS heptosyltransferase
MKDIVVLRLSSLGDVAMTVPVLLSFHQAFPDCTIRLITRRRFAPIFSHLDFVAIEAIDQENKPLSFIQWIRFAIQLSKSRPEFVFDLHDVLRTKVIRLFCSFNGSKAFVLDKGREEKRALLEHKGCPLYYLKTMVQRYADVFEKGGFSFQLQPIFLPRLKESSEKISIGIAPFAKHTSKEYGIEKMAQILHLLAKHPEIHIQIYGHGSRELHKAQIMTAGFSNVTILIDKLSFEQELAAISSLDLLLAMDSGNGHLAANYGIPVLTLWGTTHPSIGFGPYLQPAEYSFFPDRAIYSDLPVSIFGPCDRTDYERAIDNINPITVYQKILTVLGTHN